MKFFVFFAALVAVSIASPVPNISSIVDKVQAIIAAIKNPNTDIATVHLLEHLLEHMLTLRPQPEPVAVPSPAQIDFPIQPSPVIIGDIPPGSPPPLVHIIVNINTPDNAEVPVAPVFVPELPAAPVTVVEEAPALVNPIIVAEPILPEPAVILPEELN